jgi:hypothetical protein
VDCGKVEKVQEGGAVLMKESMIDEALDGQFSFEAAANSRIYSSEGKAQFKWK